jgi:hypothetical protein
MKSHEQKIIEMKKYLEALGVNGRLHAAFLGAYKAYLHSKQNEQRG